MSGALTGGQTVIRSYLTQRAIVDETDFDLILLDEDDQDVTQIFVLGQGPDGQEYIEGETSTKLDELAKPVLDGIQLIPCYALTAWRDGLAGWAASSDPLLVTSQISGEYESIDMGVDADPFIGQQAIRAPTRRPDTVDPQETIWHTVWFKNTNTSITDYWELCVYSGPSADACYAVRVYTHQVEFVRYNGGTPTVFGTFSIPHVTGLDGDYQRLDFQVRKTAGSNTRARAYVNMDPTPWYAEPAGTRPSGTRLLLRLDTSTTFTSGRLRVGPITASRTEGNP